MPPPPSPTIKTRLLLISDTHFFTPSQPDLHHTEHPFHLPLPDADILIHAGDLTSSGLSSEHQLAVSFLRSHPAELKLVIPGNHDVTLDAPFYLKGKPHMAGGEYPEDVESIRALWTSEEAVGDGIRYLEEGRGVFELGNGARVSVYASAYTPAFCDWGFAYERDEDRFNAEGKGGVPGFPDVDIMITHGPPEGILDQVQYTGASIGCSHLWAAVQRAKPRLHIFGHIHEGWGAELWKWNLHEEPTSVRQPEQVEGKMVRQWNSDVPDEEKSRWIEERGRFVDLSRTRENGIVHGESTLFVNASIMDVAYNAVQAPWVVDLDLPAGRGRAATGEEAAED